MAPRKLPQDLQQRLFDLTLALYRVTDFFPPGEILRKHLREKANEIFSQVLEYNYIESSESAILKIIGRTQSIKGYLEIARSLQMVRPINIFVLEREYLFLADFFDKELEKFSKTGDNIFTPNPDPILEQKKNTFNNKSTVTDQEILLKREDKIAEKQEINYQGGVKKVWQDPKSAVQVQNSPFLLNERQGVILEHLKQAGQAKISDFYSFFNDMSSKTIQRDLQNLVVKNLLKKEGEKRWTVYTLYNGHL